MGENTISMPAMSIEAEQAVLGACFLSTDAIKSARDLMHPRDFYRKSHRLIFEAFCRLADSCNGNGIGDPLLVMRDELQSQGTLEEIGGPAYLAHLCDVTPSAANITYHAKLVHDKAYVRNAEKIGHQLAEDSHANDVSPASIRQKLDEYIQKLDETPRPAWAFWHEKTYQNKTKIEFDVVRYLDFLSGELGYKTFTKRDLPVIVSETSNDFEYSTQRGQQIVSLKQEVIEFLKLEGFRNVANELLKTPRFFSIDILENLPAISRKKLENSIFFKRKTRVTLQGDYNNEKPFITYRPNPGENEWELVSRHDVGIIVARQGNGKTKSVEVLLSEALMPGCEPECPFTIHLEPDECIVMFATEGKEDDHKKMLRRIAKRTHAVQNNLLDEDGEFRQLIIELCGTVSDDIGFWILEKLESITEKVGLVVIDTLIDTTPDMNIQEMANAFYVDLMNAAQVKNCAVLCTIHAAPNSKDDDGKAMGHLGSLFMRKNTMMLQIKKVNDNGRKVHILTSDFRNAKSRNSADSGIYAAFSFEEDGMAHFIDYDPENSAKVPKKTKEIEANFRTVLGKGALTKAVLIKRYIKFAGCADKTARNHYESMRTAEVIENVAGKVTLCKELF